MAILDEGQVTEAGGIIVGGTGLGTLNTDTDVLNFTKVNVTRITLFNNVLTQQTIILFAKSQHGEFRKLRQYQLKLNESAEYLEAGEVLPLSAFDEIDASTTTDDAVDFIVWGDIE